MPGVEPTTFRLTALDPHEVALAAASELVDTVSPMLRALGWACTQSVPLDKSAVYRRVKALAQYAIEARAMRPEPAQAVLEVCGWFGLDPERLGGGKGEPTTPLTMVLQGAQARAALEAGEDLTALQVSLLSGIDRDHVLARAKAREIPGSYKSKVTRHRPWRFKVSDDLVQWLRERERSVA